MQCTYFPNWQLQNIYRIVSLYDNYVCGSSSAQEFYNKCNTYVQRECSVHLRTYVHCTHIVTNAGPLMSYKKCIIMYMYFAASDNTAFDSLYFTLTCALLPTLSRSPRSATV